MWEIRCNKNDVFYIHSSALTYILKTETQVEIYLSGRAPIEKPIDDNFLVTYKEEREHLGD